MKSMHTSPLTLAAVILTSAALAVPALAGRPKLRPDSEDPVHTVVAQIAAKMLYDGLRLTEAQKTDLAMQLQQLDSRRDEKKSEGLARKDQLLAALTQARDEIYATGAVSPDTRQQIAEAGRRGHEDRPERSSDEERPERFSEAIERILTAEQLEYLGRFDPLQELGLMRRDRAERAHAAKAGGLAEKRHGDRPGRFSQVREMPEDEYLEHRRRILDRVRERLQRAGEPDVDARVARIGSHLDTLRSGTEEEIAALQSEFDLPRLMERGRREREKRRDHGRHVRQLMTTPEFLALLTGQDPLASR